MASQDVLDQIRDLQSFIDEFAAEGTVSPTSPNVEEKTELPEPLTEFTILQKPNEKTEADDIPDEKAIVVDEQEEHQEKTLVETAPLSIMSYDLNLSDDFSSLLTHFKELKISPVEIKMLDKPITEEKVEQVEEPVQTPVHRYLEPKFVLPPTRIITSPRTCKTPRTPRTPKTPKDARTPRTPKDPKTPKTPKTPRTPRTPKTPRHTSTAKLSNSSFLLHDVNGSTRSRRTSVSSKRSGKSSKSARSARKLLNEKKQLQQQQQQPPSQVKQQQPASQAYVERSYDEMMRIPDIYERLAFYEKTLDLCLRAESPITNWSKANQEKGKPQPLLEGYVPPARFTSPEVPISNDSFGNINSTFGGSISMLLKKAGSQNLGRRPMENRSFAMPTSNYSLHTPSNHYSNGSGLFGRSISRLNLSRSAQVPRHDVRTPAAQRLAPLYNQNKVSTTSLVKDKMSSMTSLKYSHSTPKAFGSTVATNDNNSASALNYMTSVLPQIDTRILEKALDEAKGDPMVAISIAVAANKESNTHKPLAYRKSGSKYLRKVK